MPDRILLFIALRFNAELFRQISEHLQHPFDRTALDGIAKGLQDILNLRFTPKLRGVPSAEFTLSVHGVEHKPLSIDDTIVFALDYLDAEQAAELQKKSQSAKREGRLVDEQVSVDLPTSLADDVSARNFWCPGGLFQQHPLALAQINAGAAAAKDALGDDVNVVIVDQGLSLPMLEYRFPEVNFAGGWATDMYGRGGPSGPPTPMQPGTWPDGHGTKMAEMVLSVAPNANIFDFPLLPSHIVDLQGYLSWAAAAYLILQSNIQLLRQSGLFKGPWVLCNAWAVYDLREDLPAGDMGNYGQNPQNGLNLAVAALPALGLADVVFAAGNCGQICPNDRCGLNDTGPRRSIFGVAAIKDVLSVSAINCGGAWIGYSSEGPSPAPFASTKPDLCAPSHFAHQLDWARGYTGTSTACALTAGAVAAARSYRATQNLSPAALHARVIATASPLAGMSGDRIGSGLLNIDALLT